MPSLEAIAQASGSYGPFIAVAIATFLAVETLLLAAARRRRRSGAINTRLKLQDSTESGQATLIELRRRRGLSADGSYQLPIAALNRVLLQSGLMIPIRNLIVIIAGLGIGTGFVTYLVFSSALLAVAVVGLAGFGLPILTLCVKRARRKKKLEEQLPEAVDVMVRSLRAGHPIPVAVSMVGREMPDPIGSEFGMVSDEMTYGLDLATAMTNLRARTGQPDLALLVVAVSIQARTGGNLADLLTTLGRMIRERQRMRRKIHALSAEGRMSAIALSIVPLALYLIVSALAPSYYGDVRHDAIFMPSVYVGLTLWAVGVYTIRRLVNFKI